MFVSKLHFDREVTFWRDRSFDLEKRLEGESRRNRKREDALLNRVLTKVANTYAITEDELTDLPELVQETSVPLEVEEQFNKWADEAGVTDYERKKQWFIHKDQYLEELG